MEAGEGDDLSYRAYCPSCGCERSIYRTVPWQDDFCTECGREIDGDGSDGPDGTE